MVVLGVVRHLSHSPVPQVSSVLTNHPMTALAKWCEVRTNQTLVISKVLVDSEAINLTVTRVILVWKGGSV